LLLVVLQLYFRFTVSPRAALVFLL